MGIPDWEYIERSEEMIALVVREARAEAQAFAGGRVCVQCKLHKPCYAHPSISFARKICGVLNLHRLVQLEWIFSVLVLRGECYGVGNRFR
jgi:hypothetical protein